MHSFRKYL